VITAAANATPDIVKPTGTISGPSSAVAGQPVSFTLNAADEGGSGLNPASFAWTSAGLPAQSGQTVSFTFPSSGFFQVKVTFADNAGNSETATKSISVSSAPAGPTASPTFTLTGPGNTSTATIIGDRVRVRMRGTIKPPAGVSVRAACTGKVRLTIKKKRKTLLNTRAALKLKSGKCRFGKTVFLARSKVGRNTTRLRLKVRFPGNSVLKAGQTTKTLIIRR
jgi:PKD domain